LSKRVNDKHHIPRIPHAFFKWYCKGERYEELQGDLEEFYYERAEKSLTKARLLYWWDVIRCCQPYAWKKTKSRLTFSHTGMLRNFYSIAIRKLFKDKSYFTINILGLAVGIASFTFIALYIVNELSYDRFHSKYENIYRVNAIAKGAATDRAVTNFPLSRALLNDYPDVTNATRIMKSGPHLIGRGEKKINEEVVLFGDSTLFDVFDFKLVRGNPKTALVNPRSFIMSESYAEKYFGTNDPLGQALTVDGDTALYIVTGVFKDIPGNSHLRFDLMGSLTSDKSWNNDKWVGRALYTYIVLNDVSRKEVLEEKMQEIVRKYIGPEIEFYTGQTMDQWENAGNKVGYYLIALKDIHLRSTSTDELEATVDITYIYVYALIGIAILAIAIFNFVNLATARSALRAKEVGVRKVIGSSRRQLIFQFMFESVMVSLIAALVAVAIVTLLIPSFSDLVGKQLAFGVFNSVGLLSILSLAILVGILGGFYPALVLSLLQPAGVLKGNSSSDTRSGLRNLLVTMQFITSIVIIIGTMVIYNQIDFLLTMDLGFDKEQVLVLKGTDDLKQNAAGFKNDLLKNPNIKVVANSMTIPGKPYDIRAYRKKDDATTFIWMQDQVSYEYRELMGLEMVSGRFFSKEYGTDTNAVIINEAAAKALGFDDPIGRNLTTPWKRGQLLTIVGVVKNYHIESLHKNVEPMALELDPGINGYISIKVNAGENIRETVGMVEDAWHRYSDNPCQYFFFDEEYEKLYRSEANTGRILTIFAALSISISSLGLIGLIMHTASARRKEIGIRKVLGAGSLSVMRLLSGEFIRLVVVATAVSWPIAYFATKYWLRSFTEQLPFNLWVYVGATLIVAAIGTFAISFQTVKASSSNPVDSLRRE
jgi:putative ABC transport system permease protein